MPGDCATHRGVPEFRLPPGVVPGLSALQLVKRERDGAGRAVLLAGHPTGLMKQKELESSSRDVEALYLSQDIGEFFTNAVRQELAFSGYHVQLGEA